MTKATVTVKNKTGLHARPAAQFATLSKTFTSDISLIANDKEVNPKSVIKLLSADIRQGATIVLSADGPDEELAVKELVTFIEGLDE